METLKMVQVGTDVHDNPVFNVVKENGKLVTTTIMTKSEAAAMIANAESSVKEEVAEEPVELSGVDEDLSHIPDYKGMSKKELETTMRTYGIELDRRESKSALLRQVEAFFKGSFT